MRRHAVLGEHRPPGVRHRGEGAALAHRQPSREPDARPALPPRVRPRPEGREGDRAGGATPPRRSRRCTGVTGARCSGRGAAALGRLVPNGPPDRAPTRARARARAARRRRRRAPSCRRSLAAAAPESSMFAARAKVPNDGRIWRLGCRPPGSGPGLDDSTAPLRRCAGTSLPDQNCWTASSFQKRRCLPCICCGVRTCIGCGLRRCSVFTARPSLSQAGIGRWPTQPMRHLVNDHRLDGTQVFRLEGGEVAAARIEMHAAARRELALGVVVGDVAVVAVLVVEDDQDVLAPLRRLRHAVEHARTIRCRVLPMKPSAAPATFGARVESSRAVSLSRTT